MTLSRIKEKIGIRLFKLSNRLRFKNHGIDYSIGIGDLVISTGWPGDLYVVDLNFAIDAVAVQLGRGGGVVVYSLHGMKIKERAETCHACRSRHLRSLIYDAECFS